MISPEESAELYRACQSPDPRVHGPAWLRLAGILLPVARRRLDDPSYGPLAEDCTQEVLRKIWQTVRSGHDVQPESFVSFCITAVAHRVVDEIRRLDPSAPVRGSRRVPLSRQVSTGEDGETGRGDPMPASELVDRDAPRPEDLQERLEIQGLLASIGTADWISEMSKVVILRGYLEDWTDEDLARQLGTNRNNVQQIRHHDLRRLRANRPFVERLAEYYPGVESHGAAPDRPARR